MLEAYCTVGKFLCSASNFIVSFTAFGLAPHPAIIFCPSPSWFWQSHRHSHRSSSCSHPQPLAHGVPAVPLNETYTSEREYMTSPALTDRTRYFSLLTGAVTFASKRYPKPRQ